MKKMLVVTMCVLYLGGPALGDWDIGQPVKWSHLQLPDLSPTGMDVFNGNVNVVGAPPMKKVLADDFECDNPGLIRDIHIWGSWNDDVLPEDQDPAGGTFQDPGGLVVHLKIWSDIPANAAGGPGYSMPGQMLWEMDFFPGEFAVREVQSPPEDWFDPNNDLWIDDNHFRAFQYNFIIPKDKAFMQLGTKTDPKVYWLSLDVMPTPGPAQLTEPQFGWKTTHPQNNWNDDATFSDWEWDGAAGAWVPAGPWREMVYPLGHEFETQSVNLAFVLTPEPGTMVLLATGAVVLLRRRRT